MSWYTENRTIRSFSDGIASLFAGWTSANQISLVRIPMAAGIAILISQDHLLLAGVLYALTAALDFLDGAVARYQDEKGIAPGETESGKWLDPLSDKIVNQTILFTLGWNYLPHALLYACAGIALALTVLRPMKKRLGLGDGRANSFGKMKMWVEVALITVLFFQPSGLEIVLPHLIATILLIFTAIALAILSLTFHLLPQEK